MHDLSAKAFGFPKAIAHGMWTKARALAAIDNKLPDAFTVDVAFKRPILLPSKVGFDVAEGDDAIDFACATPRRARRTSKVRRRSPSQIPAQPGVTIRPPRLWSSRSALACIRTSSAALINSSKLWPCTP